MKKYIPYLLIAVAAFFAYKFFIAKKPAADAM